MREEMLISDLNSADLYLRNRACSDGELNDYDIEAMLDIAKLCDEAARVLENAVVLPCKVGDTVYDVFPLGQKIIPRRVTGIRVGISAEGTYLSMERIGKDVFLTREEAERALKGGAE